MVAYRMAYGFSAPPARSLLSVGWLRRYCVRSCEATGRGFADGVHEYASESLVLWVGERGESCENANSVAVPAT